MVANSDITDPPIPALQDAEAGGEFEGSCRIRPCLTKNAGPGQQRFFILEPGKSLALSLSF